MAPIVSIQKDDNLKDSIMTILTRTPARVSRPLPPVSRVLNALTLLVLSWEDRRQTRSALRNLDPHLLRDIGIPQELAAVEGDKPFWRD